MTFDLWPNLQGHVKRNLRSVPFQRLKLANFGIFAGDMDMDRCCEVTPMVYTDIVTIPRSTEVIRGQWPLMTSQVIFRIFVSPGVIWCADFEFGILLSFISIGTTQHKVADIYSAHAQLLVFAQQQLPGTVK